MIISRRKHEIKFDQRYNKRGTDRTDQGWIPDDDGLQDCDMDLWDIYADYINGKREIAEINAQMTVHFIQKKI